jgi:diphthine-ammonia ligase
MDSIQGKSFFCSWSGGKDSCLALYRAIQNGGEPQFLLTMLREDGERSHSHGLPVSIIQKQADALRIPLVTCSASWSDYTAVFSSTLQKFKEQGIQYGVFGDIDIDDHRQWCEDVCRSAGLVACHPLWQSNRNELLDEFLELQFKATIVTLKQDYLQYGWLGKPLNREIIDQMNQSGIDACGENGEYHSVVTDGPLFSTGIDLTKNDQVFHDGYWFLNVS